jgi:biopolymer transport protein ExbD
MRIGEASPVRKPIPLTALVDIVFLLLLFFMLTSTFTKFGQMDIGAHGAGHASGMGFPGAIITVSGPDVVTVNGKRVAIGLLAATLNDLSGHGARQAALRATRAASVQDLVSVLEIARTSRMPDIAVMR